VYLKNNQYICIEFNNKSGRFFPTKTIPHHKNLKFFQMVQDTNSPPVLDQLGVKKNHVFSQNIDYK